MIYISTSCIKNNTIIESVEELLSNGFKQIELSGGTELYEKMEDDLVSIKKNEDHYYYRAQFFEKEEEYEKALADYNKAIEIDPDDMDNLFSRAVLYQNNLDDYEKALADYLKIVELQLGQN